MSTENLLKQGDLSKITTYQAGILQASTHRILQKQCDVVLKRYDLSKMHWLIIGCVLDSGTKGIRLTDLSEKVDTTISYITTAIKFLELKDILTRKGSDTDNRSKLVSINEAFIPKCAEIEENLRESLRASIYSHINPEELRTYIRVMYQLTAADKSNR